MQIDIHSLSLVKPKRLSDNLNAYICENKIEMELESISVIAPFQSTLPSISINIRQLYAGYLDGAFPTTKVINIPFFDEWNEIPISVQDVSVFSSLSSIGEDLFFLGELYLDNNSFAINVLGFTYLLKYKSMKVFNNTNKFNVRCDWYIFYYLFQMFKDLSGKKTSTLFWNQDNTNTYFTNQEKTFYIVVKKNSIIEYKEKYKDQIEKAYTLPLVDKISRSKKEIQLESTGDLKHLIRSFGDLVNVREYDNFKQYSNETENLVLFFNNGKK